MPGRLDEMFARLSGTRAALIAYATAFYPDRDESARVIRAMFEAGADAVEIGVPFSDPVLDGPVIQGSSSAALAAGATPAGVLELAGEIRMDTESPLLLMSYYNPVFRYGLERFARDAIAAGVDAVAIPDLPVEEMGPWSGQCEAAGLGTVAFCAMTTEDERMRLAGEMSSGFLYCVSVMGTTGARERLSGGLERFLKRVRAATECPLGAGLGISTPEQCSRVGEAADAVIVGSALVEISGNGGGGLERLKDTVGVLAGSLRGPRGGRTHWAAV